jgi:hypothetical protein
MVYKVKGELYAPDLKGVNAAVTAGGDVGFELNGKKLDELPADAVLLTDTEVIAQFGGAGEEPAPEEKPKKRSRPKAETQAEE